MTKYTYPRCTGCFQYYHGTLDGQIYCLTCLLDRGVIDQDTYQQEVAKLDSLDDSVNSSSDSDLESGERQRPTTVFITMNNIPAAKHSLQNQFPELIFSYSEQYAMVVCSSPVAQQIIVLSNSYQLDGVESAFADRSVMQTTTRSTTKSTCVLM